MLTDVARCRSRLGGSVLSRRRLTTAVVVEDAARRADGDKRNAAKADAFKLRMQAVAQENFYD